MRNSAARKALICPKSVCLGLLCYWSDPVCLREHFSCVILDLKDAFVQTLCVLCHRPRPHPARGRLHDDRGRRIRQNEEGWRGRSANIGSHIYEVSDKATTIVKWPTKNCCFEYLSPQLVIQIWTIFYLFYPSRTAAKKGKNTTALAVKRNGDVSNCKIIKLFRLHFKFGWADNARQIFAWRCMAYLLKFIQPLHTEHQHCTSLFQRKRIYLSSQNLEEPRKVHCVSRYCLRTVLSDVSKEDNLFCDGVTLQYNDQTLR